MPRSHASIKPLLNLMPAKAFLSSASARESVDGLENNLCFTSARRARTDCSFRCARRLAISNQKSDVRPQKSDGCAFDDNLADFTINIETLHIGMKVRHPQYGSQSRPCAATSEAQRAGLLLPARAFFASSITRCSISRGICS